MHAHIFLILLLYQFSVIINLNFFVLIELRRQKHETRCIESIYDTPIHIYYNNIIRQNESR